MSQENVEIVRRAYQALNLGDIDALLALCDVGFRLRFYRNRQAALEAAGLRA